MSSKEWTAWLIENGESSPIRYRTIEQGMVEWTEDPLKALHFCRREDAERFAQEDIVSYIIQEDAWKITEHLFLGK